MRKTERILIAVLAIAICVWFLFPTIRWYAFVSPEDKALTTGSSLQVKEYSQGQARTALHFMEQNGSSEVPKEYSFVIELAKSQSKENGTSKTDIKTCSDVLSAFSASSDEGQAFMSAVEKHYREYVQSLKELSSKALQLGLDLPLAERCACQTRRDAFLRGQD